MAYRLAHNCLKVRSLEASLRFYTEILHMQEKGRVHIGETVLVYLGDESGSAHELELNYHPEHAESYRLGENPVHLAFVVDDYEEALAMHRKAGCIELEIPQHGIHFLHDPDGYLIEILPQKHFSLTERGLKHEN